MNEPLATKEINKSTNTSKLFGLPRTTTGVLIGVLIFLLVEAIFRITNLFTAFIILLSPGVIVAWMTIPRTIAWGGSITAMLINYSVLFGISSIPPAILGSLIISDKKETKSKGIILSIIYLIILLIIGIPISTDFD
jgi:hypothetical protein